MFLLQGEQKDFLLTVVQRKKAASRKDVYTYFATMRTRGIPVPARWLLRPVPPTQHTTAQHIPLSTTVYNGKHSQTMVHMQQESDAAVGFYCVEGLAVAGAASTTSETPFRWKYPISAIACTPRKSG